MTFLTAIFINGAVPATLWRTAMICDTVIIVVAILAGSFVSALPPKNAND